MRSFLKRYRELVLSGVLLVLPIVVYASHAGEDRLPGSVRTAVVWATAYPQRFVVAAMESAQDAWFSYVDLRGVRGRNLELRAENLQLKTSHEQFVELEKENERLRKLAAYVEAVPEMRLVAAPVVAYGPDARYRSLRIGRGTQDGIRTGMPVVTPDGVVGRVLNAYDNVSDVLLITDPSSAVAALSQRTRARATARGISSDDRMRLEYVIKSDNLEESDILVTAPSGGLFPKGLRLGRATRVNEAAHGLFKSAELVPFVDFTRLEEVQVIVDQLPSARLYRPFDSSVQ